jgi:hypothetical protein
MQIRLLPVRKGYAWPTAWRAAKPTSVLRIEWRSASGRSLSKTQTCELFPVNLFDGSEHMIARDVLGNCHESSRGRCHLLCH